jgi:outer membrane protein insertion porin family
MTFKSFVTFLIPALISVASLAAEARPPRVLKFSGVPMAQAQALRKRFPFVFEREITLGEVDEITRFLMASGAFSNIEVVERDTAGAQGRELVLVASLLRKIHEVKVSGNKLLTNDEVLRILNVKADQPFERKNLLAAANELREEYERLGYHEVTVTAVIKEGTPVRVTEVAVDTPNEDLAKRLNRMARSLRNRTLTEDELLDFQKNASDYLRDNRYLTARLSNPTVTTNADRTQAKLVYSIENPYRFEFRLEGNQYFSDGTLAHELESEKLSGATTSPAPDMAERLRRYYQAAGFANVEITYQDEPAVAENGYRQLIRFKVVENPRVRIKRIEVTGNVSRPESYYTQFIKSSSSDLIGAGFYNRKDIDDGGKLLITELQNQGYLRAKIQSQRAEYSKDRASVVISLNIDEGPLTQIRQIRLDGAESFPRQQLLEMIKIKAGAALSLQELEESLGILKDFYHHEGFLEMRIVNEGERNKVVVYNDSNTQATVNLQIYEGPRVVVRNISLKGNTFTKDYVILRELAFQTNDVLTPEAVSDSVTRLQTLGFFSRVSIRTLEEGTNLADRTVEVEVVEADPGLFTLGAGVNNERDLTFRGYLGLAYRNLGGTGRGIVFRVDPKYSTDPNISYLENRITLSYIEPFIFNNRNIGRVNLVRDQSYYGLDTDRSEAVILETNSVGFLLEKELTKQLKVTYTAYNFANQTQFYRKSKDTITTQNIAKTGPLFELDTRDNVFYPAKGSYSYLNLEYSDPLLGSSKNEAITIQFAKANAGYTWYQRLSKKSTDWVWASSIRGGYLTNLSTDANAGVPGQEDFFLGGRSTIRGFDASDAERIPNNFDLGVSKLADFTMKTHSEYALVKTEIRFPLWRNFPVGPLGGVIFYDGGAVFLHQDDVHLKDPYRDAAGVGLRVATPVGPLNLEIGWKLDRREYAPGKKESPFAFHFSIGTF